MLDNCLRAVPLKVSIHERDWAKGLRTSERRATLHRGIQGCRVPGKTVQDLVSEHQMLKIPEQSDANYMYLQRESSYIRITKSDEACGGISIIWLRKSRAGTESSISMLAGNRHSSFQLGPPSELMSDVMSSGSCTAHHPRARVRKIRATSELYSGTARSYYDQFNEVGESLQCGTSLVSNEHSMIHLTPPE